MLRLIEEEASSEDIRLEIERHSRLALAEHVRCMVHSEVLIYRLLLNHFHSSAVKNTKSAASHAAARSDVCARGALVFLNLREKGQQYGGAECC